MKLFKFFQYAYLVFSIVFFYNVVSVYMKEGTLDIASLLLAAAALFMFFFRKRFNKKIENKDDN
ncbi:hypothetical protein [Xanthomarina sp. F2636L]|uniref:hypothetical protein n=1 Tax=Xanthomarina sp. F2636L TaxID=2996018 RepID=UPI00225E224B|nr:hypothetical protein [Xanthomarina sp. F2636L]